MKRIACLIIAVAVISCGCSLPSKPILDNEGKIKEGSIVEEIRMNVNGISQWLLIRGHDIKNPVMLFIHGGPGLPASPVWLEKNKNLERDFTIVLWEQRGSAKSFSSKISPNQMTIDLFIEDVRFVTEFLQKKFSKKKIILSGHSWGTMLGALSACKYPDLFSAFIPIGMYVDPARQEDISYEFTLGEARRTNNNEAEKELVELGPPVHGEYRGDRKGIMIQRKWLARFGGVSFSGDANSELTWAVILCREYSLMDKINYQRGIDFSLDAMIKEIHGKNMIRDVPVLKMPVFMVMGERDYNTPVSLAREYFNVLEAPFKEFILVPLAAHNVHHEKPEEFHRIMVERVRPRIIQN